MAKLLFTLDELDLPHQTRLEPLPRSVSPFRRWSRIRVARSHAPRSFSRRVEAPEPERTVGSAVSGGATADRNVRLRVVLKFTELVDIFRA